MFFNLDFYGFIIKMSVTDGTGGFSHAKVTKKNPLLLTPCSERGGILIWIRFRSHSCNRYKCWRLGL